MPKKITINYKISDDMKVSFSGIEKLREYGSLKKFKELSRKYVLEIDNQMNAEGKILEAGKLEFKIENNQEVKNE